MLPNFIIVGAPKAGTTSLYHYLSEHPQIFMSTPKEVNYFSKEEIEGQGLYYKDFKANDFVEYESLFTGVSDERAIGEGSVSYLFYPETPKKIKKALPNVKIIILLREPVSRGFSHYLMDYRLGLVDASFEEIVFKRCTHKTSHLYFQQYVELGLYFEQVKRYLSTFGNNKVKIYLQDDLRQDPKKMFNDLFEFLEIDNVIIPNIDRQHNVFSMPRNGLIHSLYASPIIRSTISRIFPEVAKEKIRDVFFERKKKPELEKKSRQHLIDYFQKDIQQLERLIERDLSHWYRKDQ